jgi:hypothetical protein
MRIASPASPPNRLLRHVPVRANVHGGSSSSDNDDNNNQDGRRRRRRRTGWR